MAQRGTAGKKGTCNTKTTKSRVYCFTCNNYTKTDIDIFTHTGAEYCFQEETGAEGTPHLQGVLIFKNAVAFNSMKKLHAGAHWEAAKKNKKACIRYCSKIDTRTGKLYHNLGEDYDFGTSDPGTLVKVEEEKLSVGEFINKELEIDKEVNRYWFEMGKYDMMDSHHMNLGIGNRGLA